MTAFNEDDIIPEPLLPPPGEALLLPGYTTAPVEVRQFRETTQQLLERLNHLVEEPRISTKEVDIEVASAIIPSMNQGVLQGIRQVDAKFKQVGSEALAPAPAATEPSSGSPSQGTDQPRPVLPTSAVASAQPPASTSAPASTPASTSPPAPASAGEGLARAKLVAAHRHDVLGRLAPYETWLLERASVAAEMKASFERVVGQAGSRLHCLEEWPITTIEGGSKHRKLPSKASPVLIQSGLKRKEYNFLTRALQIPKLRTQLLADPTALPLGDPARESAMCSGSAPDSNSEQISQSDLILVIAVYHKSKASRKVQEFLVLGSQYLCELTDQIYCLSDYTMSKDQVPAYEERPSDSCFLYIEGTFYNDGRAGDQACDYSAPILAHLQKLQSQAAENPAAPTKPTESGFPEAGSGAEQDGADAAANNVESADEAHDTMARCARGANDEVLPKGWQLDHAFGAGSKCGAAALETTRFIDLKLRVGAPCVYCHKGCCEHRVVVRDIRMVDPKDVSSRDEYPLLTFQAKFPRQRCTICDSYVATMVVPDDPLASQSPAFFCYQCFDQLHGTTLAADDVSASDLRRQPYLAGNGIRVFPYYHD